jgi:2-polyprenyl-3-methyl-5-hydroxy-6-metoxy-1,4-benzoquinol methylase
MAELWETHFAQKQLIWGSEPTESAQLASDYFAQLGIKDVLIPGVGYGRNAKGFLAHGMTVTGIEISETAISLAKSQLGLDIPIHHGSVTAMPFDNKQYDGIFCYGLIYLLNPAQRAKLIHDCFGQLSSGGCMIFTVISKTASFYGEGIQLGDDWFERGPGLQMFYYDAASIQREFGAHGLVEFSAINEPMPDGQTFPFFNVICKKK